MKSKNCQFYPKKRRGLSSIVGALLFVVLMVATFSVLGIALNTQTDIVSTARDVSATDLKKQQEEFGIGVSTNGTEILSIDVNNVGQNPVEIFTVLMTNVTDVGFPTTIIEIPSDTSFIPSGDSDDIVSTLDLKMKLAPSANLTSTYNFKVISSLGTIKTVSLQCSFTECGTVTVGGDLIIQLFADGPTGVNTKISTIIMFVTNTADFDYTAVTPTRGVTDMPPTTCNAVDSFGDPFWKILIAGTPDVFTEDITPCDFDAIAPITLKSGQTTLFKWDTTILGDIDTVFEFCNRVEGRDNLGDLKTFPDGGEECDDLIIIDPNDCGGCGTGGEGGETIILIDDLLIKPSIFMVIPSPFGDTQDLQNDRGVWGINVANPTDTPLAISKVTIVAYPPGGNSQDTVFNGATSGKDCLAEDIHPGLGTNPFTFDGDTYFAGFWTCPRDNILMWQNFTDPITVLANTTQSFMVKVEPSVIKSGDNIDALIVQANVYSTFGSFGKAAYQSSMYEEKTSIVNVYLTDTIDSRTDIQGFVNDIPVNSTNIFKIVLVDLDDQPDTVINAGARLIINVPREWTFNNFVSCDGFDDDDSDGDCDDANMPTFTVHADGSTQLIGITQDVIGDGVNDARTIEFSADAPDVIAPRLYVMYVLADGIVDTPTGGEKTIGPLNEIVLNVDPLP